MNFVRRAADPARLRDIVSVLCDVGEEMETSQEKFQSDYTFTISSSNHLQEVPAHKTRKYSDCSRWLQRMYPHIALEWDDRQNKVVAKKGQVGLSWRQYSPFYMPSKRNSHMVLADVLCIPQELFQLKDLSSIFSSEVWGKYLSESERKSLSEFLPKEVDTDTLLESLFQGENFHFGNPLLTWASLLCSGEMHPDVVNSKELELVAKKKAYYSGLQNYHTMMLKNLERWKETWRSCKNPERELLQRKRQRSWSNSSQDQCIGGSPFGVDSKLQDCKSLDNGEWKPNHIKITQKRWCNAWNSKSREQRNADSFGTNYGDSESEHSFAAIEEWNDKRLVDYWMLLIKNDIPSAKIRFTEFYMKRTELRKMLEREIMEQKLQSLEKGSIKEETNHIKDQFDEESTVVIDLSSKRTNERGTNLLHKITAQAGKSSDQHAQSDAEAKEENTEDKQLDAVIKEQQNVCKASDLCDSEMVSNKSTAKMVLGNSDVSKSCWNASPREVCLRRNMLEAESVPAAENATSADSELMDRRNIDSDKRDLITESLDYTDVDRSYVTDDKTMLKEKAPLATEIEHAISPVSQETRLYDMACLARQECDNMPCRKRPFSWSSQSPQETLEDSPFKEQAVITENGKKPCFSLDATRTDQMVNCKSHSVPEASNEGMVTANTESPVFRVNRSPVSEGARELAHHQLDESPYCSDARILSLRMDDGFAHASDLSLRQPHPPDFNLVREGPPNQEYRNAPNPAFLNHLQDQTEISSIKSKLPVNSINHEIGYGNRHHPFSSGLVDGHALEGFHNPNCLTQELQFLTDSKPMNEQQSQVQEDMQDDHLGDMHNRIHKQQIHCNQPYLLHHSQHIPHSNQQDVFTPGLSQNMTPNWPGFLQVAQGRTPAGAVMQQYDLQHGHWNGDCQFQSAWCPDFMQRQNPPGSNNIERNMLSSLPEWSRPNQMAQLTSNNNGFGDINNRSNSPVSVSNAGNCQIQTDWSRYQHQPTNMPFSFQHDDGSIYRTGHVSWMNVSTDQYANPQIHLRQHNPGLADLNGQVPLKSPWDM